MCTILHCQKAVYGSVVYTKTIIFAYLYGFMDEIIDVSKYVIIFILGLALKLVVKGRVDENK